MFIPTGGHRGIVYGADQRSSKDSRCLIISTPAWLKPHRRFCRVVVTANPAQIMDVLRVLPARRGNDVS
jgi:hypothetical protein